MQTIEEKRAKFAADFKAWRAEREFSQSEASEYLGISVRTLQGWEAERAAPRGYSLKMLNRIILDPKQGKKRK